MVEWKGPVLQFISAVIGSGLVVTVFSSFIIPSVIQPHINFQPVPTSGFSDLGYSSIYDVQNKSYTTTITNDGSTAAKNLIITFYYPEAKSITDFKIEQGSGNISDIPKEGKQRVELPIPKLAVDEKLVTSYTLVDVTNDIFGPPNIISARYDYSVSNGEQAGYDECLKDCFTYPFDTRVFVITLAFSLALIAIAIIPRYVQQFRSKNDQRRVVSQIANQIRSVQIELSNDRS